MKKYNVKNYIRYKEDIKQAQPPGKFFDEYTRDELIVKFTPLVENIARKFATSQEASGVLSIMDLIQHGNIGLILAVDKLDWDKLMDTEDIEKTLKSFLSKRIKGSIRRAINTYRGNIRLPEYKINEMNNSEDKRAVELFFNTIFLSMDDKPLDFKSRNNPTLGSMNKDGAIWSQVPDHSEPYNEELLNSYIKSLLKKHLNKVEYEVLRLSYGLDCEKHTANEIASKLSISGVSAYVRVSELKKEAIKKLVDSVDHSQVLDYL